MIALGFKKVKISLIFFAINSFEHYFVSIG
jgi:hypothetical protein